MTVVCLVVCAACASSPQGPRVEFTCPRSLDPERASVVAAVRDETGHPLPGVTVHLLRADGSVVASRVADAEGLARFSSPEAGEPLAVRARLPGFLDAQIADLALRLGCRTSVELTLRLERPGG
jgi:hypothetical protein